MTPQMLHQHAQLHPITSYHHYEDECTTSEASDQIYSPQYWNHQFPNYEFVKLLTSTESSLVWLATFQGKSQSIAVKLTQIFEEKGSEYLHQTQQNDFLKQYHLPHMVQILDLRHNQSFRALAMKPYPYNLRNLACKFTNNKTMRYTKQHQLFVKKSIKGIIISLQQLHSIGYVHRDLKPDNILVDDHGQIILGDFGLVTKELAIDPSLSGTLEYIAPERLSSKRRKQPIKRQLDIWSLGIILYELFTGQTPFNGQTQTDVLEQICQGSLPNKQLPVSAMSLLHSILQLNSKKRLTLQQIQKHQFLQSKGEQSTSSILLV